MWCARRCSPRRPRPRRWPDVSVEHSPLTLAAPPAGYLIDARVLVISTDGSEPELAAIRQTLGYLGTPFDVFIAGRGPR